MTDRRAPRRRRPHAAGASRILALGLSVSAAITMIGAMARANRPGPSPADHQVGSAELLNRAAAPDGSRFDVPRVSGLRRAPTGSPDARSRAS